MYQAGCFFGAIFGYPIGYFLSRQYCLFLSAVVFVIGATMQMGSFSSTGLGLIYGGCIIVGPAISVASNLAPIYVAAFIVQLIHYAQWMRFVSWHHIIPLSTSFIPQQRAGFLIPAQHAMSHLPLCEVRELQLEVKHKIGESKGFAGVLGIAIQLYTGSSLLADHPYLVKEVSAVKAAITHEKSLTGAGFFEPLRTVFLDKKLVYHQALWRTLLALARSEARFACIVMTHTICY
ncbi:hypothetical protein BT96DRAFT_979156 [Gymnopus androsaceus JB14]|uniref:Uncharacterized protein n=1 Tax=Gymnopus androsaceus JB14 TaxID=1447944 RepID=A0A6A4H6W9_9AGAR|nr:hypothetical protein BT96DRAFT_979156 [Gymnopus androsaceus JB14]